MNENTTKIMKKIKTFHFGYARLVKRKILYTFSIKLKRKSQPKRILEAFFIFILSPPPPNGTPEKNAFS
jgi:hypothetical protein